MKRNRIYFITCCLMLAGIGQAIAQGLSNKGTDFWVGYGHHQFMENGSNTQQMTLYFSTEAQAATVRVSVQGTPWFRTYTVPANSVISTELTAPTSGFPAPPVPFVTEAIPKMGTYDFRLFTVPCGFLPPGSACGGEGSFSNKGIHIESDVPIVAYAHIYGSTSSGATMLMPVETWGYSYVTLNSKQSYAADCFSWAYVIAQHDNTVVEITPSQTTRFPRAANVPFTVTLNRGGIYQIMAGPETGSSKPEFSGTKFKSIANAAGECYPVAVFAGSSRTNNPFACGSSGGDNDNQQCFPSQAWGKRYLTAPTSTHGSASTAMTNAYKIAVKDPLEPVFRNGTQIPLGTLQAGTYYYFESNLPEYITSAKPMMVAQFMTGGTGCSGSGTADPEMMYISPIEQGIKRIGFFRNNRQSILSNYLTLIIPTAGLASLRIDGSPTFDHIYVHPRLAGYSIAIKRWTSAQAQAVAQSDSAFTAITYGLGGQESYGYNAGTLINNLNAIGDIRNTSDTSAAVSHPFTCTGTPVKLSVLLGYPTPPTRLVWKLSTVAGGISPNTDVTINAPVSTGSQLVNGITYYKYELPGTYTFASTGSFKIPILATHPSIENCTNTEEVFYFVEVRGKPSTNFAITHTGCILDTVHFTGQTTSANGYALNQWRYTFPDATISNSKDTGKLFAAPGTFNVNLRVVSTEGCVGDTTKQLIIYPKPIAAFTTNVPAACQGTAINFTSTGSYTGTPGVINNYYWDFGDNTIINAPTNAVQSHTYLTPGTYSVKHTVGVSTLCVADTVTRIITVYAPPTTSFTYPAGCLPATGTVQFTSTASTPDGQVITGHLWNFGDPASGANNTSTLSNPTHTYPGFGNYTITYRVTTANGCTKDTTVNATFNLSPTFAYPALAPVCVNATAPINVATASVTNGVPGTFVYNGPGTTPTGDFFPAVAGPGNHTIWYVYTTNANCRDSISRVITVYPKPDASFSITGSGCLPASGIVSFNYNGVALTGQTYLWNFGDPASGANNTSTLASPTHNYSSGSYTISLTITSANGCIEDSVVTQAFNVTPALAYPALTAVCENLAPFSIANATVTNAVTGTGVYSGPGTTANGTFNPSIAGAGTHTITYTFTSAGNCTAVITQTIVVFAKPTASFTVPTAACLPASGVAQFTYNGSLSAGQSYLWNFGDPASGANNASTLQSPTHTYTNTGSYAISLTVTNSNGCIDDTVITRTLGVTPALNYPALAAACNNGAPINVGTATVTNAVTGTGVYSGPGTDAAGNFDPAVAGPGNHTITYTFTSTGNCVATATQTIRVNAAPSATFTASTSACLPANGNVGFTYTGAAQAAQTYLWDFGDPASGANNSSTVANPSHNFSEGNFRIILTVTNPATGCIEKDTLIQTFALTPALNYPALVATCNNTGIVNVATATVTNAVPGTGVYSGPGTDAAGNFNPAIAGPGIHTITYTFTSAANCVAVTTQTIRVNAAPSATFTASTSACLPASGNVGFTYTGTAQAGQTYSWDFGDPASGANNTSAIANPSHNFAEGNYRIILTVTNPTTGCVEKDTLIQTFALTPALNYPALTAGCENLTSINVASATVTNSVPGTGVYSGPGTSAAGIFNPSVAGPGTHTITYTFTSAANCVTIATQTIVVNAKPNASFTYPTAACLPTTGFAQFNYNGSLSAGQSYLWNFGDPTSGPNNTATVQSPSHTYTNTGNYNVSVSVTNTNGCIDDSVINITFSVTPALNYPVLASVCESVTGNVSVATATVTNSVTGTGVYSGPGVDASGNFNPATAGAGTHTITYTFTSSGNCVATTTQTILVNPKPLSNFTITNSVCLGAQALLTSTSSIPSGTISTWRWFYGDGNTATFTNGSPHNYAYSTAGTYTVKLVTVSANGCTSDTANQTIVVNAVPVASFTMPASVCMPNGSALFTNTSTLQGGGTLSYDWNFGDGNTSTQTSPAHVYGSINSYNVTLRATSAAGCFKDTMQTFSAFFDKPVAFFNVKPDSICQGAINDFADLSTAPNSTIKSRLWIFGDGTTSTAANPTKRYSDSGSYKVQLVVTNNENCVSDTFSKVVRVYLQPVIDAGPSFIVSQGTVIRFAPTANDSSVTNFLWSPAIGLSNAAALRPTLTATSDQVYTLTATGAGNCTDTDFLTVKILRPVIIPNAFSPNGDNTNDRWQIDNLTDYSGVVVEVFNRYGQLVHSSVGYGTAWDGSSRGKPLPVGTYYYIIQLKNGFKPLNGSVTIIR